MTKSMFQYPTGVLLSSGKFNPDYMYDKFGHNDDLSTSQFVPVSIDGTYRTPQVSGATTLRVKAGGDAADTAGGAGAQRVYFEGLDPTGALITDSVATAGAAASAATTKTFIRLFRAWVEESGTYATALAGSHVGDIVIEDGAGSEVWAKIHVDGFPAAQSEISAFTVPLDYKAYVVSIGGSVQSTKSADIIFFKRESILDLSAPYSRMSPLRRLIGIANGFSEDREAVPWELPELTDVGFMAKAAGVSTGVSAHFSMVLVKTRNLHP